MLVTVTFLSACTDQKDRGYIYDPSDARAQVALSHAKREFPRYFEILKETSTWDSFYARQVFGREVECVVFENSSSIIIHIDLPIYCFKKASNELVQRL